MKTLQFIALLSPADRAQLLPQGAPRQQVRARLLFQVGRGGPLLPMYTFVL